MKIRSFIFLTVIVLGLFPLFVLVALNLPKTIDRLEYAAELETQARSQVDFAKLNARIRCLKKSLLHSTTLPSTLEVVNHTGDKKALAALFINWFALNDPISGFSLFDASGRETLGFFRSQGGLVEREPRRERLSGSFLQDSLGLKENEIFVGLVDEKNDPLRLTGRDEYTLILLSAVREAEMPAAGVLMMRIDMSTFLENFKNSLWVTENGTYLKGCQLDLKGRKIYEGIGKIGDCNAFEEFPGLKNEGWKGDPLILKDRHNNKIAWMPLIFHVEKQAVMWVGTVVDESAIESWKFSLMLNVVVVICMMSLLVFFAANWITVRIDAIQKDLLVGLDNIINNEKKVVFDWKGPAELKGLGDDLTSFASRYTDTCEARMVAEAALRESEDKFRNLTASALDGIILMDHEGNIAYWNEAAATIFGFTSAEALGSPVHQLIDARREGESKIVQVFEGKNLVGDFAHTVELVARHRSGSEVLVELSLSSTRIKNKWHAIWIVRDVTERKRSEEQARKQQQQLQHADKMISLGLLVSGVAHEINNPNSIALLNLPVLARAWESVKPILDEFYNETGDFTVAGVDYTVMRQQLPRVCAELEESAARIRQIVVDLKDYARAETSGQMIHVDMNDVVQSGVRLTMNSICRVTKSFSATYVENLPKVLGNRQRLVQVVINLIQNSCEALGESGGAISVSTRYNRETDGVEIVIRDEGGGIASDVLNKVTDPFFTTKRNMGGTGLGLSVSAGIVKEHNGMIYFDSMLNQGTEVIVSLPALCEPAG
ncbi:MAG: PAS domain S-box protein [Proteobacteria bacterium]|jgi:PAS domain S-box-containing protein|nr:PAS domain S-box protein [Desulfocapsa sp.]MBU3944948.1 PAS domain S-box protein [Pseudomonadota bacterium]MCG2743561.1 PAS domain S-box protein [Desulfobacteraceae bacterium]MBU4027382.1 PAS domain S-box protein [Pseudomonadota bacterium]MBU4044457.1 PAS domain S-box protein [Pseudomonadota bacterium]